MTAEYFEIESASADISFSSIAKGCGSPLKLKGSIFDIGSETTFCLSMRSSSKLFEKLALGRLAERFISIILKPP